MHPEHSALQELWENNDASFIANVGALVEPTTKQQFLDRSTRLPKQLYAHNIQTQGAKTLTPETTTGKTGVLGRIFAALDKQAADVGTTPLKGSAYSISSDRTMFRGSPVEPILLSSFKGKVGVGVAVTIVVNVAVAVAVSVAVAVAVLSCTVIYINVYIYMIPNIRDC